MAPKDMLYLMDEFFERFQMLRFVKQYPIESAWHPPTDIFDMGDHILVKVEMAGIKHEDLSITLQGESLTIKGTRREEDCVKMRVIQMEIIYGYFERNVRLPCPVDSKKASVNYVDGLLEIKLPKSQTVPEPTRIMLIVR